VCAQPSPLPKSPSGSITPKQLSPPPTELHAQAGMSSNTLTPACGWQPASQQMQPRRHAERLQTAGLGAVCVCASNVTPGSRLEATRLLKAGRHSHIEHHGSAVHRTQECNADCTRPALQVWQHPLCPGTRTQYSHMQTAHKTSGNAASSSWRNALISVGFCSKVLTTNKPVQCSPHCPEPGGCKRLLTTAAAQHSSTNTLQASERAEGTGCHAWLTD
jgi:hypothetical protein